MASNNRILNRKKTLHDETAHETIVVMTNHDFRTSLIDFNYDDLNISLEDKEYLLSFEKELAYQGKQLGNVAYIIGENLSKAKEIFKKYPARNEENKEQETFVNWYTKLGLSKDQVSLFLGRYNLVVSFPEYKERVISLSDRVIKETINKKTSEELTKKVLLGELKTSNEIKSARALTISNQISSTLEISEAEIMESVEDKNKKIKKEIQFFREEAIKLRKKADELDVKADELEKHLLK